MYRYDSDNLVYIKTNKLLKYRVIVAVLFLSVSLLSFVAIKKPSKEYITAETEVDLRTNSTFSEEKLIAKIKSLPFKHKDLIMAQCILESSNFTSPVFKENNNLLGLREARQRLTLATGTNLNHATFNSWQDCLLDRLIYEAKYLHGLSREQYLQYLDKSYAVAGGYDKVLEQIVKKNKLKEKFKND